MNGNYETYNKSVKLLFSNNFHVHTTSFIKESFKYPFRVSLIKHHLLKGPAYQNLNIKIDSSIHFGSFH